MDWIGLDGVCVDYFKSLYVFFHYFITYCISITVNLNNQSTEITEKYLTSYTKKNVIIIFDITNISTNIQHKTHISTDLANKDLSLVLSF